MAGRSVTRKVSVPLTYESTSAIRDAKEKVARAKRAKENILLDDPEVMEVVEEISDPISLTPYSTQPTLKTHLFWDQDRTLSYLQAALSPRSQGRCASAIWDALEAGGIRTRRGDARDIVKNGVLENAGFTRIGSFWDHEITNGSKTYTPQKGDIVVSAPDNNPNASGHHISMYTGNSWLSDFRQSSYDVYSKDNQWYVYRLV